MRDDDRERLDRRRRFARAVRLRPAGVTGAAHVAAPGGPPADVVFVNGLVVALPAAPRPPGDIPRACPPTSDS